MDASSTTHAWDRSVPSRTNTHNISFIWWIRLIKSSIIQSNATSVQVWYTKVQSKGVLCCIVTYTSHLSIFLNGVATDTVDAVLHGCHYSAVLILRPPTKCVIRATFAKSTMSCIYKCFWNVRATFCWSQLSLSVLLMHTHDYLQYTHAI